MSTEVFFEEILVLAAGVRACNSIIIVSVVQGEGDFFISPRDYGFSQQIPPPLLGR